MSLCYNSRMIHLQKMTKDFADRRLFREVNWHIRPVDRIGLCGDNGAGKTTLLKILGGQVSADGGDIHIARGTSIGYLPQDGLSFEGRSLFAEVQSALQELLAIEEELRLLEEQIAKDNDEEALERYSTLQELFRQRGGYTMTTEIAKVLNGLGFAERDWEKPCEHFSGGWQMRIALAKLLLQRPNLLLLDEPTNHLDLPARDWLEVYLKNYPFAIVLVSHDRFFLDQVVGRIVEVWNGTLSEYPGNYSQYLVAREERIAALRAAKERQDEEIAKTEAFINRFRYQANKASLVQSRVKQLEKIERIEVPPMRKRIAFRFPPPPKSGRQVMEIVSVGHGYDQLEVLRDVNLTIERQERVALVGANGAGKSTLMRLLAGVEAPRQGKRNEGHNLQLAYFAQDQARTLNPEHSVLEEITAAAPFEMVPRVRDILGTFLFSGDDVHKPVKVLSGGERNRLALAILLLRPANLLLLDEPTNHLDLQSKDVLLNALRDYTGTLIFVSHDRYFVDALASRVLEVASGVVTSYPGNYEDFLRAKESAGDASHSELRVEQKQQTEAVDTNPSGKEERLQNYQERKDAKKQERQRLKELAAVEEQIETLEGELAALEESMADPAFFQDGEKCRSVAQRHEQLQEEIAWLYERWDTLQDN